MKKNKWLAGALNIVPGLGYLYAGGRTLFAVLLLSAWPLFFLSAMLTPMEEYDTMGEVTYRIWDFLPGLVISIGFMIDGAAQAVRTNAFVDALIPAAKK